MAKCYICTKEILQNETYNEHIILNALGGKLKSKDLICSGCAPKFDSIDAVLAKQLNFISNMLNIKRDRGNPQPIKASIVDSGQEIYIKPDGEIILTKTIIEETDRDMNIRANTERQLRDTLKGKKRSYPQINVERLISEAVRESKSVGRVEFQQLIGGLDCFRSVCKMAINFYIYKGGNRNNIIHLIDYIKQEKEQNCTKPFSFEETELTQFLQQDKIIHTLIIKGEPKEKILYAFIEFFSTISFVVLLNEEYTGSEVSESYFFDVLERQEMSKEEVGFDINLEKLQIEEILQGNTSLIVYEEKIKKLVDFSTMKQKFDKLSNLNETSIENITKIYPENEPIPEEAFMKLSNELAQNIIDVFYSPFL